MVASNMILNIENMEKFKRYLGLAMALGVLILGFLPLGPDRYFSRASKLTPLDSTALTYGILRREMRGDMYFWLYSTDYFNSCPPFQEMSLRTNVYDAFRSRRCDGDGFLFSTISQMHEAELTAIEPRFPSLLAEYEAAINAERSNSKERQIDLFGNNSVDNKGASTRRLTSEFAIGSVMNKYLGTRQVGLAATIYVIHGLLLMAVLFMVWGRRSVGGLVWFPFSLIFGAARIGAKAAQKTHDKI